MKSIVRRDLIKRALVVFPVGLLSNSLLKATDAKRVK
jgi:hypothetical protein